MAFVYHESKESKTFSRKFAAGIIQWIIFLPSYLYILSIKSTFYFYWPIIFVYQRLYYAKNPHLIINSVLRDVMQWVGLVLSIITIGGIFYRFYDYNYARVSVVESPWHIFEYVLAIDFKSIALWQWFNIISALLTFLIFYIAQKTLVLIKYSLGDARYKKELYDQSALVERLMRVRKMSTMTFFGLFFSICSTNIPLYFRRCPNFLMKHCVTFFYSVTYLPFVLQTTAHSARIEVQGLGPWRGAGQSPALPSA